MTYGYLTQRLSLSILSIPCVKCTQIRQINRWHQAMRQVEQQVGYQGTGHSLQYSLSDEISSVVLSLRKLVGTGHPLLKTAKQVLSNGQREWESRSLIYLLICQAGNSGFEDYLEKRKDDIFADGILQSQRTLGDIMDIVFAANRVHCGVLDQDHISERQNEIKDQFIAHEAGQNLEFGNKMSVLGGDYLLSCASTALAKFGIPQIVSEVAEGIADMTKVEFIGSNSDDNLVLSATLDHWLERAFLGTNSLFAHSSRASLLFAPTSLTLQNAAFDMANNIGLALKISEEITSYRNSLFANDDRYLFLCRDRPLSDFLGNSKEFEEKSFNLKKCYVKKAMDNMTILKNSKSKDYLNDILNVLNQNNVE